MFNFSKRKNKIFFFYIITFILPLISICVILYTVSLTKEESSFMRTHKENIYLLASRTDFMMTTFENISFQVAASPAVNTILSSDSPVNIFSYYDLGKELNKYIYSQSIIYSMYAYFKPQYTVYTTTEGKIDADDFYDHEFLVSAEESKDKGNRFIPHTIQKKSVLYRNPVDIISIVRELPITMDNSRGMLVINLNEDVLSKEMDKYSIPEGTVFIIDSNNNVVAGKNRFNVNFSKDELNTIIQKIDETSGNKKIKLEGKTFFLAYTKSQINNWKYISLVPYGTISENILNLRLTVFKVFIVIALISIIIGYFLSEFIYLPFKKLIIFAGDYMRGIEGDVQKYDEISMVSKTMEKILEENSFIKSLVGQYTPIIKEKVVSDILFANITADEDIKDRLEYSGLSLKYNRYVAAVSTIMMNLEFEEQEIPVEFKIYAASLTEQIFLNEGIITASTLLEDDNIAFILNLDVTNSDVIPKDRLKMICSSINTILYEKLNIKMVFAFGTLQDNLKSIANSFVQARKAMNYRAFSDADLVILASQEGAKPDYPVTIHKEIINGIKTSNQETVKTAVDRLFSEYMNNTSYSQEKLHQVLVFLYSSICGELIKDSGGTILLPKQENISHLLECKNLNKLRKIMVDSFIDIIMSQENNVEEVANDSIYISKTIGYIKDNYNRNISLADISSYINLNPRYLAKIFKNATGKTLFEHLNQYRIKMSKELFNDITLSIKDISKNVGYNDVHSFIKSFKKQEGITPGEFRDLNYKG